MYMYLMNHRLGRGAVWYKFTLLLLIRAVYFKLLSVAVDAHTFFYRIIFNNIVSVTYVDQERFDGDLYAPCWCIRSLNRYETF